MNFWKKLFNKKESKDEKVKSRSPFMPQKEQSVEILFANNFTKKGGRFLFSESESDLIKFFKSILQENKWTLHDVLCLNKGISNKFKLEFSNNNSINKQKKVVFIKCEFLIATTGSFLISSNQIKSLNLVQLPKNIIVQANTAQFARDVSEAMSKLKLKYNKEKPSNITTLTPKSLDNDSNLLYQGSASKNIYLLLQE
ncbi:MAG: hypothetical protein CMC79_00360 [Flavobacteriaceae bacterium]|nr:hypothetical protein [Flavobacteriaceae bacterium]